MSSRGNPKPIWCQTRRWLTTLFRHIRRGPLLVLALVWLQWYGLAAPVTVNLWYALAQIAKHRGTTRSEFSKGSASRATLIRVKLVQVDHFSGLVV